MNDLRLIWQVTLNERDLSGVFIKQNQTHEFIKFRDEDKPRCYLNIDSENLQDFFQQKIPHLGYILINYE